MESFFPPRMRSCFSWLSPSSGLNTDALASRGQRSMRFGFLGDGERRVVRGGGELKEREKKRVELKVGEAGRGEIVTG